MSEHEEYTTNGGGACSTCDQEWPCRDALAERVRELEAALDEANWLISEACHDPLPRSLVEQAAEDLWFSRRNAWDDRFSALAASSQPEAGAAVCRCRHPLSDHGDGGCLFEHGIGAICSCLTFDAGAAVEA